MAMDEDELALWYGGKKADRDLSTLLDISLSTLRMRRLRQQRKLYDQFKISDSE